MTGMTTQNIKITTLGDFEILCGHPFHQSPPEKLNESGGGFFFWKNRLLRSCTCTPILLVQYPFHNISHQELPEAQRTQGIESIT